MANSSTHKMAEQKHCDKKFEKKLRTRLKVNFKLLPLKLVMLLVYGGMGALYPYLTVHMKSLGITLTETAVIYSILPFVSCIGPPIGGALADKIGNYKVVMIAFTLVSVAFHLLMWFAVPSALPTMVVVENQITNISMTFPCSCNMTASIMHPRLGNGIYVDIQHPPKWPQDKEHEMRFLECFSTCQDAKMCVADNDCSFLDDMKGRYLTNVSLAPVNKSLIVTNYATEEGEAMGDQLRCETTSEVGCHVSCDLESDFVVSWQKMVPATNRHITLAVYTTFRFVTGITVTTMLPLLDATGYQMAEEHDGDLGFQRMFALVGVCAFPPISGYLTGLASRINGFADYSPAFYIFGLMHFLAAILTCFMSLSLRGAGENIWKNVGKILANPKVMMFVIMMFLAGCAWGFLENFLFWFMEDIGSPKWLLGMTNTVSALAAIPIVAASTFIMKHMGHTKLLILCMALYGCRFVAYSFIYNPFLVLPVELLEAFTASLLWIVASVYCGKMAPDYLATLQGVIGSMHCAMGRGIGSLMGGIMFEKLKPRLTYQVFGAGCFGVALVYGILHYSWLRNVPNPQRDDESGEPEKDGSPRFSIDHELSPEDEEYLRKFAQMDAFARRYTLAPVITESAHADRRRSRGVGDRRRSTLAPSLTVGSLTVNLATNSRRSFEDRTLISG